MAIRFTPRSTSASHIRGHEQAIKGKHTKAPLEDFRDLKLSDITAERVRHWMEANIKERPTFTAVTFRKLRAFLNWCADDQQKDYRNLVVTCVKNN